MNREERNKTFTYHWKLFSKRFILDNPKCFYCDNPTYATGHTKLANDFLEQNGFNLLEPSYYVPVCRSCNALMKTKTNI